MMRISKKAPKAPKKSSSSSGSEEKAISKKL